MKNISKLTLLLFCAMGLSAPAASTERPDALALWQQGALRGANVMLGQCTVEDLSVLRSWGANLAEVPVSNVYAPTPPYAFRPENLAKLDQAVKAAEQAHLYVALTCREGPGRPDFERSHEIWRDAPAQEAYAKMWREVAAHYRGRASIVGYDLMCEPHPDQEAKQPLGDWNALAKKITAAIREVDPQTPILVNSSGWAYPQQFEELQPTGDPRTVYTVHFYDPHYYTHQKPGDKVVYPGFRVPGKENSPWDISTPAPIPRNIPPDSSASALAPTTYRWRILGRRRLYQQGARGRRLSLLVPRHRSLLHDRAHDRRAGAQARSRSRRDPPAQLDPKEQFPYDSALGWEYDSGDYHTALEKALKAVDYAALRDQQRRNREAFGRGETRTLMGIGLSFFTEIVGAGPIKNCDILGLGMFDSCEIRIHPTGSAIARLGTISQGQGHATTFAQILATEIGIPAANITIEEGDTDTAPYGLGTYGSRSTPVAGAATAMAGRKIRAKAQMIAAYLLEVHDDDLEWDIDRFVVKGATGALQDHGRDRVLRLQQGAAGDGAGARGGELVRSAEHDLSLRRLYLRRRHRCRYRRHGHPPLLRARRLRHAHQPDDHRGPGAWRADRGAGHRHGPGDGL